MRRWSEPPGTPRRPRLSAIALFGSIATIVGLDQSCKVVSTHRLRGNQTHALLRVCELRHVLNTRPGLIRLSVSQAVTLWLAAITLVALGLVFASPVAVGAILGLGLGVGGAASNLCDRILHGGIVDFIVVGRWPPFNVADAAMVGGTALALGSLL